MKILLVSGHRKNWDAGASTAYLHLDQEMRRQGHDCTLLNAEDYLPARLPSTVQKLSAAHIMAKRVFPVTQGKDVVEVAGNLGWVLFQRLRLLPISKRPLLVTRIHGLELKDEQARIDEEIARSMKLSRRYKNVNRHWINWQEFRTIALADVVTCYTSREKDILINADLKEEQAISVVPLGVDQIYMTERQYADAGNKLLWWGSWLERKGISALPRAFELACRALPELTLTIGGSGTDPAKVLENFAPAIRPRVTVLPFVSREEHVQILHEHDVFVFPSLSEGFGFALLEAMATGMPCITTFTGLAHDWLEHGRNCFLVPMSAPTSLARAIECLQPNSYLRKTLGESAHETATKLTWERFGRQTEQAYAMRRSAG